MKPFSIVIAGIAAAGLAVPTASQPHYSFNDLGTFGGSYTVARAINASGVVAGDSVYSKTGQSRAFTWQNGVLTMLPLSKPLTYSLGSSINDGGTIAGTAQKSQFATPESATVWNGPSGSMQTLTGNNVTSMGNAINNFGDVGGMSVTGGAYVWLRGTRGAYTAIQVPGAGNVFSINDNRIAACRQDTASMLLYDAIAHTSTSLPLPTGFTGGSPSHINSSNQVSATFGYQPAGAPRGYNHALVWLPSDVALSSGVTLYAGYNDLTPAGFLAAGATCLTNPSPAHPLPTVVGWASADGQNAGAYVWTDGVGYNLNTLTTGLPAGSNLSTAYGVNDAGQIVGEYRDVTGATRAFLLTPLP